MPKWSKGAIIDPLDHLGTFQLERKPNIMYY